MDPKKIIIAIDGPSASGKGTIAKILGEKLNLPVLYTGNIFRAIALNVIEQNIPIDDLEKIIDITKKLNLEELIKPELSAEAVGECASVIAVYPEVRKETNILQRNFIKNSPGAVVEGRDIGTVICPEAPYKFFITADVEARAKRRFSQLKHANYDDILFDLVKRDERDKNREASPLKPAEDAIFIDNSKLSVEETIALILNNINRG